MQFPEFYCGQLNVLNDSARTCSRKAFVGFRRCFDDLRPLATGQLEHELVLLTRKLALESGVNPFRRVVEQILEAVSVLTRHPLACRARREPVRRTFDDDELFVAAC